MVTFQKLRQPTMEEMLQGMPMHNKHIPFNWQAPTACFSPPIPIPFTAHQLVGNNVTIQRSFSFSDKFMSFGVEEYAEADAEENDDLKELAANLVKTVLNNAVEICSLDNDGEDSS